jgi:uncharacterized protein (TIGR02147 family)
METIQTYNQNDAIPFDPLVRPDVFSACSIHEAISKLFAWKKSTTNGFSVRILAKRLNMRSHSLLAMYSRGERLPTIETLNSISAYFELKEPEFDYLVALLLYQKAKTPVEKNRLGEILLKKRSKSEEVILESDDWSIFERWYHIAILEMTRLKSFQPDASWIAMRLGDQVTLEMVEEALKKLLRSKLIVVQPDGTYQKAVEVVKSKRKTTTLTMRSYQKQMLQRAALALDDQPVPQRLLTNLMIPFDSKNINEAKEMVMSFIEGFQAKFDTPEGDCVYSLGTQLFQVAAPVLTKKRNHLQSEIIQ